MQTPGGLLLPDTNTKQNEAVVRVWSPSRPFNVACHSRCRSKRHPVPVCACWQVLAVGPGAKTRDGNLVPMSVAVGDKVVLPEYGGVTMKWDNDEEVSLFRDEDIIAKIEE